MTESSVVALSSVAGGGLAGLLSASNPEAAVGALFGALIYVTTTVELPVWQRALFFLASFVMGYLFAPALAGVQIFGVALLAFPGPAAFAASLLVVSVSLAALRRQGRKEHDRDD